MFSKSGLLISFNGFFDFSQLVGAEVDGGAATGEALGHGAKPRARVSSGGFKRAGKPMAQLSTADPSSLATYTSN